MSAALDSTLSKWERLSAHAGDKESPTLEAQVYRVWLRLKLEQKNQETHPVHTKNFAPSNKQEQSIAKEGARVQREILNSCHL